MPGDGIGRIVLPEALRVLEAVGFDADYVHGDIGWEYWIHEGNPVARAHGGAARRAPPGASRRDHVEAEGGSRAELAPNVARRGGHAYTSPVVALRQRFGLEICIRPCRSFPGNPLNFVRRAPDGGLRGAGGRRGRLPPEHRGPVLPASSGPHRPRRSARRSPAHPRFAPFVETPGEDLAVSTRIVTRDACRHILTAGFDYARKHGYRSVTLCEKPNVLRETSGMMEEVAHGRCRRSYPDIPLWSTNIDAQMMWLTKQPRGLRRDRRREPVRRHRVRRFRRPRRRPRVRRLR